MKFGTMLELPFSLFHGWCALLRLVGFFVGLINSVIYWILALLADFVLYRSSRKH